MVSAETELLNIFYYYCLHGNPLFPHLMTSSQFTRVCRQCGIIDNKRILEAEVELMYKAEIAEGNHNTHKNMKSKSKSSKQKQKSLMDYKDFLNVLMKLSEKVYPTTYSIDKSFELLLVEKVLPYASRRNVIPIDEHLNSPNVVDLFHYYENAILSIFKFYASVADHSYYNAVNNKMSSSASVSTYTTRQKHVNSMKEALAYADFLKFAMDFNLSSNVLLSSIEMGNIYLCATEGSQDPNRKLSFEEFWECLVRCALTAYSKISNVSTMEKLKGLFLFMWRALHDKVPRAIEVRRNVSTYSGDLLAGAMAFNNLFTAQWRQDGYRDYLSPTLVKNESARDVLKRLLRGGHDHNNAILEWERSYSSPSVNSKAPPAKESKSGEEVSSDKLRELISRRPSIANMLERSLE